MNDILATLMRGRPRLLLDAARADEIRACVARDSLAKKIADDVCRHADEARTVPAMGEQPPPGSNLLYRSRQYLHRVLSCGLAAIATGSDDHVATLRAHVLEACGFAGWAGRENFLATAEMATAVAIGYDWFHDRFSDDERAAIRRALIDKALEPARAAYRARDWWVDTYINWNQVSNAGIVIASLAVADSDPEYARELLPRALEWLPLAIASFDPDGAFMEGAAYWSYAIDYSILACSALETALGSDFSLSDTPGMRETAMFPLICTGPSGLWADYSDLVGNRTPDAIGNRGRRETVPSLLWLAHRYRRPVYAQQELAALRRHQAQPFDLLWYRSGMDMPTEPLPLAKRFGGPVALAVMRSGWEDPDALWAYIKAGDNEINHTHLDLGAFELDALGQRWATDLGAEDYGLPGYFDRKPGGGRWKWFRLNSEGHNVPMLDGRSQEVRATAQLVAFSDHHAFPFGIVDLGPAYAPAARRARRGLMLLDGRAALVQDEFALTRPCRFAWGMTTDAAVAVDGARAELTLAGKALTATILAPEGARFAVASADRPPPERPNPGVSRLTIAIDAPAGDLRVAVHLAPRWADGVAPPPALRPLAEWAR